MSIEFETYRQPMADLPTETLAWNMYGPGIESIGKNGQPELVSLPEPQANQLLVRVDAVGMCFSDVKLIKQGGQHPKLYNRDLAKDPTRLGHEAALTIMKVGEALQGQYEVGQRLALQPDIYVGGKSTAYGYTIPGGLIQYHLIGPEVLDADHKSYVLPVSESMGYAETALTEPWACVEASYTQRRRLTPKAGGTMWILGQADDVATYEFSAGLEAPSLIVMTDVPASLRTLIQQEASQREVTLVEKNGLTPADYPTLRAELTNGVGFDDIVILAPHSAVQVSEVAKLIARRGTFNLVGLTPLDDMPQIDVGRIHYDYTAYVGNAGSDIAASYGEARNRCELRAGGTAVFVGAGGPMGQMHVQRAIELRHGPAVIIASDVNENRLEAIQKQFGKLAEDCDKTLLTINPTTDSLPELVQRVTENQGADDVVVSVPIASVMAEADTIMRPDGMLVLFAGVPNGTFAPLDLSQVYLSGAQYTGTSGSALADQSKIIQKTLAHELSPNRSVSAVGGMDVAQQGVQAMMEGRYPGKIVIFPQLKGLPLLSLEELKEQYPEVGELLAAGDVWTSAAEHKLIERFWQP